MSYLPFDCPSSSLCTPYEHSCQRVRWHLLLSTNQNMVLCRVWEILAENLSGIVSNCHQKNLFSKKKQTEANKSIKFSPPFDQFNIKICHLFALTSSSWRKRHCSAVFVLVTSFINYWIVSISFALFVFRFSFRSFIYSKVWTKNQSFLLTISFHPISKAFHIDETTFIFCSNWIVNSTWLSRAPNDNDDCRFTWNWWLRDSQQMILYNSTE